MQKYCPPAENHHSLSKIWNLVSPDGTAFMVRNLSRFVREHPSLFPAETVVWKRRGGEAGCRGWHCSAITGISNLRQGRSRTWRGWRLRSNKPVRKKVDWQSVDWRKSCDQIAAELGRGNRPFRGRGDGMRGECVRAWYHSSRALTGLSSPLVDLNCQKRI